MLAAGHSERAGAPDPGSEQEHRAPVRGRRHRRRTAGQGQQSVIQAGPVQLYLRQRQNEGITTATVVHAELRAWGWQGSVQAVERCMRPACLNHANSLKSMALTPDHQSSSQMVCSTRMGHAKLRAEVAYGNASSRPTAQLVRVRREHLQVVTG